MNSTYISLKKQVKFLYDNEQKHDQVSMIIKTNYHTIIMQVTKISFKITVIFTILMFLNLNLYNCSGNGMILKKNIGKGLSGQKFNAFLEKVLPPNFGIYLGRGIGKKQTTVLNGI